MLTRGGLDARPNLALRVAQEGGDFRVSRRVAYRAAVEQGSEVIRQVRFREESVKAAEAALLGRTIREQLGQQPGEEGMGNNVPERVFVRHLPAGKQRRQARRRVLRAARIDQLREVERVQPVGVRLAARAEEIEEHDVLAERFPPPGDGVGLALGVEDDQRAGIEERVGDHAPYPLPPSSSL